MTDGPDPDERRSAAAGDATESPEREPAATPAPGTYALGRAVDADGDVTVDRDAVADGLAVLGGGDRAAALAARLARQAVVDGDGAAVVAPTGPAATWFDRALPDDRAASLRVVGGADGRSVNLVDPGVPPDAPAFFDAVDAVTDALASVAVVVDPRLRDAVREFVMAAGTAGDGATLVDLRGFVRDAAAGDGVPRWVREASPDLPERVAALDAEAVDRFVASLAPLVAPPARDLLCAPDPDLSLVEAVRAGAPLAAAFGDDRYDQDTRLAAGRALAHFLWGAAREFAAPEAPYHLVADAFGPALDAEPHLDRLFARLHRDPVVPAFGVRDPAALGDDAWPHLATATGAGATFALSDPAATERAAALVGVDADRVASLPADRFRLRVDEAGAPRQVEAFGPP